MLRPFIARLPVEAGAQDDNLALARRQVIMVGQDIAAPPHEGFIGFWRLEQRPEDIEYLAGLEALAQHRPLLGTEF